MYLNKCATNKILQNKPTFMERGCELPFPLNSLDLLFLVEDNNSHHIFPSAPLEAARFKDRQEGLLRHSKMQSKMSYNVYVPILATFR